MLQEYEEIGKWVFELGSTGVLICIAGFAAKMFPKVLDTFKQEQAEQRNSAHVEAEAMRALFQSETKELRDLFRSESQAMRESSHREIMAERDRSNREIEIERTRYEQKLDKVSTLHQSLYGEMSASFKMMVKQLSKEQES